MPGIRKTVQVGDIHLSYLEWERGSIPLLLLHGLADNALVWSALGEALSDRYHIVAVDLRGHGDSSKPDDGYEFDRIIADLEALMGNAVLIENTKLAGEWNCPENFAAGLCLPTVDKFMRIDVARS